MRILQINQSINTGSIGRTTYELNEELQKRGHESFVIFEEGQAIPNSYKVVSRVGYKIHALLSRVFGLQGYFSFIPTLLALRIISKFRPDVIHLRNLHGNYINIPLLLKYIAKNNIPTIVTLHDLWLLTGKCTYPIKYNCLKFTQDCGNCPATHSDVNPSWFFDKSKKCLNDKRNLFKAIPRLAVVGVSQWATDVAKQSFMSERKPFTIYNWIDLEVFKPRNSELRHQHGIDNKFVLLFVSSSFSPIKGFYEMCWLANNCPHDWAIVAIGAEVKKLPEQVIHINHTNDAIELAQYYSMADVCVNLTQFETFGKVTAEALCCGTPVLVYNNSASPELVGDGCGYVIEQHQNFEHIIRIIKQIQKNGKFFYSQKCRDFAIKKFSKQDGVDKYISLYEEIINNGK